MASVANFDRRKRPYTGRISAIISTRVLLQARAQDKFFWGYRNFCWLLQSCYQPLKAEFLVVLMEMKYFFKIDWKKEFLQFKYFQMSSTDQENYRESVKISGLRIH